MNDAQLLQAQRQHLGSLLEAIQRCVYFLAASDAKLAWPLTSVVLEQNKKEIARFETLAAINERFAKPQDTLGAAMRHTALLSGEASDTFIKVLTFFEKVGVVDSIASWQLCRTTRNLAAHDYGTDYTLVAASWVSTVFPMSPSWSARWTASARSPSVRLRRARPRRRGSRSSVTSTPPP